MELASQIFLSLKFEIEKLLDPFPNILYPLLVKIGWTSSFFGLILIFLQEWRIERKKYRTYRSFHIVISYPTTLSI